MRKGVGIVGFAVLVLLFFSPQSHSAPAQGAKPGETTIKKVPKKRPVSVGKVKQTRKINTATFTSRKSRPQRESGTHAASRANRTKKAQGIKPFVAAPDTALTENDNDEYLEYRMQRGDTLDKIAQKFNVDREELIDLNQARKKALTPGRTVLIPKAVEDAAEDSPIVLNDRLAKPWKNEEERGILVKVAKSFAGAPYRYGGESIRGLDCSAFVKKMYDIFEVQLPRTAREQFCAGPRVNREELAVGDLVFFKTKRYAKYPTHVGIYIGEDKFIHASSLLNRGVKVDRLSDRYFTRTYTGAVRLKAPPPTEGMETEINPRKVH